MTPPFEPQGPLARWRLVYDVLLSHNIGETVTYARLGEVLDLDPDKDRQAIQMAMQRAAKEYLTVDNRAVAAQPNVGYRIVEPAEHMQLAQNQQRRSTKALQRGRDTVTHVDLSKLDPEVRKSFEVVARAFSMQIEFNKRMDVRQERLEKTLDQVSTKADRTDEEVRELKARLEALENKDDPKT